LVTNGRHFNGDNGATGRQCDGLNGQIKAIGDNCTSADNGINANLQSTMATVGKVTTLDIGTDDGNSDNQDRASWILA
jgi:hypothetical protein